MTDRDGPLLDCLLPDGDLTDVLAEAGAKGIAFPLISGEPRQAERLARTGRSCRKPFTQPTLPTILDTARRQESIPVWLRDGYST